MPPAGETRCLHELFAERAARDPEAVALRLDGRELRYGELDRRADRLAATLARSGVGPEVRVAVFLERSFELVVAILAVLKAGGAYVPLDPASPRERLEFIVRDAGAVVVLTDARLSATLAATGARTLLVDDAGGRDAADAPRAPTSGVRPDHLAYLIYTSGTTGRPKGSLITHANVTRLFSASEPWFGFGPADVWTLFHSIAFDFSVWELFGALLHGGRLVIVPYLTSRSPGDLYALLVREGVTVLNQTPSAFRQLMAAEAARGADPRLALRLVIFGGEALDFAGLRPWFDAHGDERPRLVNGYGITETTVFVTFRPVSRADAVPGRGSLIGRPIPDLTVHLLDESRRPVPDGVEGEIVVGGAGVGRGYLDRPELTAERFIADPFSPAPGARLYRSGDLARRREDGDIEYLGRRDQQVKVRGFRIETGEIESRLGEHPAVAASAVVAREDQGGEKRLVAYLVPRGGGAPPSAGAVRSFLAARLPEYMVPPVLVVIDALPLDGNGKLDRRALPAPEECRALPSGGGREGPRTAAEREIAGAFAGALGIGVERFGVADDFFALGGDSLLATRAVARVAERLGRDVPVRAIFEAASVEALAAWIEAAGAGRLAPDPPPGAGLPRATSGQERVWLLRRMDPGAAYNVARAVRLTGPLDPRRLEAALRRLVDRHPGLRTTYALEGGALRQRAAPSVPLELPVLDLGALAPADREEALARAAAEEVRRPFDPASDAPLRAWLHRLAPGEHVLVLSIDHIAIDEWSLEVLLRELGLLYGGAALPAPRSSPAEVAARQAAFAGTPESARLLAGWRARLEGKSLALEVPRRRPPPAPGEPRPIVAGPLSLDATVAGALAATARAEGATPFAAILALFALLLGRFARRDEVVVGAPFTERGAPELEGVVAFLQNTLPLGLDLSGDPSFRELVRQARRASVEAMAGVRVPFGAIAEAAAGPGGAARGPAMPSAMLAWETDALASLRIEGVRVEPVPVYTGAALCDVLLFAGPGPGGTIRGRLEVALDVCGDAGGGRALAEMLRALCAAAAARPDLPCSRLALDGGARGETDVAPAAAPTAMPAAPAAPADCSSPAGAAQAARPVATADERLVAEVFSDVLGVPCTRAGDSFFELGGHSLAVLRVVARLEERSGRALSIPEFYGAPTVEGVARLLARPAEARAEPVAPVRRQITPFTVCEGAGAPPLFILPGLGSSLSLARDLSRGLRGERSVHAFAAPWDGSEDDRVPSLEDQAAALVPELLALQPRGAFHLTGYSLAGFVAYEAACQLVAAGHEVRLLAVIDTGFDPPPRTAGALLRRALLAIANLPFWLIEDILRPQEDPLRERVPRKLRVLGRRLRRAVRARLGAPEPPAPPDLEQVLDVSALPERYLRTMRASLEALSRYRPRPYPGRLTLLRAWGRPLLHSLEPDLGWSRLARGGVRVRDVAGNHDSIVRPPHVRRLALALQWALDEAGGAP